MTGISLIPIDRLELSIVPWRWPFAQDRRTEIDAYFAARRQHTPEIWNGRVLLAKDCAFAGRLLRGNCFETDFASFIAWRDWGYPDRTVTNCFAMGAVRGCDGAFILGVMGPRTANPGRVYFPAGTPDPDDISGGKLDLDGNVLREIAEETGLTPDDFAVESGWRVVVAGPRIAFMKSLTARQSASDLRQRILGHIGREQNPELADVCIVRGPSDFDPMMPDFVMAFLMDVWRRDAREDELPGPASVMR